VHQTLHLRAHTKVGGNCKGDSKRQMIHCLGFCPKYCMASTYMHPKNLISSMFPEDVTAREIACLLKM